MENLMNTKISMAATLILLGLVPAVSRAGTTYTENFTGATTQNSWYFFNGACLTAGSTTMATSPGQIPSCVSIPYYSNKGDAAQVGGNTGLLPDDPLVGGALRFTDGAPGGYNQNGAILSNFTFGATNGLQVTFTTESYEGNSAGGGGDGADGISFFLQSVDQGQTPDLGAFGGSLGYTCSNRNNDPVLRASGQPRGYDGLTGAYIGLGIDEYGNFLNPGDNTSTGPGYQWDRIGLRGAGSTAWAYLATNYPLQYPSTLTYAQRASAVQQACQTGFVWDWSQASPVETSQTLPNYGAITYKVAGVTQYAAKVLTGTLQIANEGATLRGNGSSLAPQYGVPITYNLKITTAGILSLSYSYNGGVYQPVITGQDISASNGLLPNNVRFGFAGSTGGGTNIHEIMCFQAAPVNQTSSSAGVSQKQSAKVQVGTQVYFAYYNSDNWQGSVTSQYLIADPLNPINLIIAPTANWDASCVLTKIPTGQSCGSTGVAGPTSAEAPTARTILTYDGTQGIPLEWSSITTAQQNLLGTGETTPGDRLNYLRGDRTNELTPLGVGEFRARTSVLGDIIDSSPTWVGPPNVTYLSPWRDAITGQTMPENSGGAQTYAGFKFAERQRTNVVYAGSNDGLLHGFRSGSFDASGNYVATNNDGQEVLAYMPAHVLRHINSNTDTSLNYSDPQYSHSFEVDATPGTGDVFFGNAWHTWLVGGLGEGGAVIYALDVTDPSTFSETGSGPKNTVIGEWNRFPNSAANPSGLTCVNVTGCGSNLGKTYGTPQIRRFHNGSWGAVFGNGFGSTTGDAGIYVMLLDPSSGAPTFYYLTTNQTAGAGDGIGYTSAIDLDGDAIVDYVYAGDLLGNVWRFDLTDPLPTNWVAGSVPLFTTPGNQPITTQIMVIGINNVSGASPRLLLEFGTGQQVPFSNLAPATYATTQQALYGLWDWNMGSWNSKGSQQWGSLPAGMVTAPTVALTLANLQPQTITGTYNATLTGAGNSYRTISTHGVCYADTVGCTGTAAMFGWYLQLPVGPADPTNPNSPNVAEQLIFSPNVLSGALVVNTTVPPTNTPQTCSSTSATSWFMGLDPTTGGALPQPYLLNSSHAPLIATNGGVSAGVSGEANLGVGSPSEVLGTGTGGISNQHYIIVSPNPGGSGGGAGGGITPVNPPANTSVKRITWIQKR
jgi:type IV pilus assembly protein PilY1